MGGGERPTTVNNPGPTVSVKDGIMGGEEGRILEVYAVPLLGLQTDNLVTVQDISPDVVFQRPQKPKPAQPPIADVETSGTDPQPHPNVDGDALSCFTLSVGVAAVTLGAAWLARRAYAGRGAFASDLNLLEADLQASCVDLAPGSSMIEGTFEDREREAERRVSALKELITRVAKANKRCPWEARGKSSRRLAACSKRLSKGLIKAERAAEELSVMSEIDRLLHELDNLREGDVYDEEEPSLCSEDGEGVGAEETGDRLGDGRRPHSQGRPPSARLSTRANVLLTTRSAGVDGRVAGTVRCVFRAELKRLCDELAAREQQAVDRLKRGLQRWDLDMVDTAISHLRLLELPDLVKGFRERREDVRGKLWCLREELREAQADTEKGRSKSRLRQACVKAEMFSKTDWPEYQSAKRSLESAHIVELEVQARRIKAVHGMPPDEPLNVRLDSSGSATVLLGEIPNEFHHTRSQTQRLALASDDCAPGVDRRLVLETASEMGETSERIISAGAGVEGEETSGGQDRAEMKASKASTSAAEPESLKLGCTSDGVYSGTSAVVIRSGVGEMQQIGNHSQTLSTVRNTAESSFLAYVMKREKEHRRACDADRKDVEDRENNDVYRKEHMARLDTRNVQEKERLRIEEERLRLEEEERWQERKNRDRRRCEERLDTLWSADDVFFRLLAVVDVAVASVAVALRRGFTLAPRTLFNDAWTVVVAECNAEDDSRSVFPSSLPAASEMLTPSPTVAGPFTDAEVWVRGPESTQFFGDGGAGSLMLRAWASAGSAAATILRAGYSSVGWVLGETLGLMTPNVQCEVRAVMSLGAWLLSLILALKIIEWAGADGQGRTAATARLTVVVAWVWGRFKDWLLAASRELMLSVLPVPILLVLYGASLKYFERHRKPDGFWWMGGWDVRPLLSRALPAVASLTLAWFLDSLVI